LKEELYSSSNEGRIEELQSQIYWLTEDIRAIKHELEDLRKRLDQEGSLPYFEPLD